MAKPISIRDLAIGFALGASVASLLPVLLSGARGSKRELVKSALKGTMRAAIGSAERLAEFRENVEDLLAEVSAELAEEASTTHAAEDTGDGRRAG